jgi:hypothetical protein
MTGTVFPDTLSKGADIINFSVFFADTLPPSSFMQDCFDYLTTYGCGGKGVVLFFSAGDTGIDSPMFVPHSWAAYKRTIAIASSTDMDIRDSNSNFGVVLSNTNGSSGFKISRYHDCEVLEIGATKDSVVELPLRLAENKYTPILVAMYYDKSVDVHKGELSLTQRRSDGELSEGYSIMIRPIIDKKTKRWILKLDDNSGNKFI